MKKFLFVVLTLFSLSGNLISQATIDVAAPLANISPQSIGPTGVTAFAYMRGCFLIKPSELSALTTTLISAFGFSIGSGASSAVNGNIAIYMQNTGDVNYTKGSNYASAITPMTNVYTGTMTIPAGTTNTANILLGLNAPFNYTGGGLYIAFSWTATPPFASTGALYACNNSTTSGAFRFFSSNNPTALNTLVTSSNRPVCIFNAVNTATNEAAVIGITAPGKVPEAQHVPQIITANIKNNSNTDLYNLPVNLDVTGINTYADTQTLSVIMAGAVETVTFSNFIASSLGTNTIEVYLNPDENLKNNSLKWHQEITCNIASNSPPVVPSLTVTSGYTSGGISTSRFNFPVNTTLYAIDAAIADDFNSDQKKVYGVLMDGVTGIIMATTNTLTITQAMFNSKQTFSFSPPEILYATGDYNIGMAQPQGGHFPYPLQLSDSTFVPGMFYDSPINGGSFTVDPVGYSFYDVHLSGMEVNITQATTVICHGTPIRLVANGAATYTWSSSIFNPVPFPNNNDITVTPTGNEIYTVSAIDDAGCAGVGYAPVMVYWCIGFNEHEITGGQVQVAPNPAVDGNANLIGLQGETVVKIYNVLGELIFEEKTQLENYPLNLSQQAPGTYFVSISGPGKNTHTLKLLKP